MRTFEDRWLLGEGRYHLETGQEFDLTAIGLDVVCFSWGWGLGVIPEAPCLWLRFHLALFFYLALGQIPVEKERQKRLVLRSCRTSWTPCWNPDPKPSRGAAIMARRWCGSSHSQNILSPPISPPVPITPGTRDLAFSYFSVALFQTSLWSSGFGMKLEAVTPFLGKYRPFVGRCCQTCTPKSWVSDGPDGPYPGKLRLA
jgi:hypothetical protein